MIARLDLPSYDRVSDDARMGIVASILEGVIGANRYFLEAHPDTTKLLASKVRYGTDGGVWADIPSTLERGRGDCRALVAWRIAELRRDGESAAIDLLVLGNVIHARVRRTGGAIEDTSRLLGMR